MERRLGPILACLLGCGDNEPLPSGDLVGDLAVERVATASSDRLLASSIAAIDTRMFVIARATTQGADFCARCLEPEPTDCAATCRRAVLEVSRYRATGVPEQSYRFHEVFPATPEHDVDALDVVALDETHAGVAWLECDNATCGPAQPKQSCTARYTAVDLLTGRPGPIETLYQDWYGELRLAFNPRTRQLLALVGKQAPSSVGVRAAIYDEQAAALLAPWATYGGPAASAPTATASAGSFVIVADDPVPGEPGPADPCAEACDCLTSRAPEIATGGLFAFRPGVDRPAERISPGRAADGSYVARRAIAAIEAGGRVIVASTQGSGGSAELFEAAVSGWTRQHASQAPLPAWLGVLADETHLAWLGYDPDPESPAVHHLVAGAVLIGELEQRGELDALEAGPVLDTAPVSADNAVTRTLVLRSVPAPPHLEVLAVRAGW